MASKEATSLKLFAEVQSCVNPSSQNAKSMALQSCMIILQLKMMMILFFLGGHYDGECTYCGYFCIVRAHSIIQFNTNMRVELAILGAEAIFFLLKKTGKRIESLV